MLDRLTVDKPKLVVFDVVFDMPSTAVADDEELREAIKRNGKVVLAAAFTASGKQPV